jgi:hypothetical protein
LFCRNLHLNARAVPSRQSHHQKSNKLTHTHDTCHTHTTHVTGNSSVDHGHFILPLRPQSHDLFILSRPFQRNPVVPTALQHLHKHKRRQAFSFPPNFTRIDASTSPVDQCVNAVAVSLVVHPVAVVLITRAPATNARERSNGREGGIEGCVVPGVLPAVRLAT